MPTVYEGISILNFGALLAKYKFSGGEWSAAGRGETGSVAKNVMHHDGVMPGAHWMRQPVNFERVKITNNPNDTNPSHVSSICMEIWSRNEKEKPDNVAVLDSQPDQQ
ncbi:T-box [Ancylostoma duodenale]|uniref:T-box n=1 Tax=Ancylostoma duodenale TaxID=51022 RepID=A0A0C2C4U2_9BILA|nr:T-box [Ancylostoma duodenale]